MSISNQEAERILREGISALQHDRPGQAKALFGTVADSGRANVQVWLLLATACRADGDAAGEESALDQVMLMDPRVVRAHIMKGDCRARAGDDRTALNFYASARMIADGQPLPADLVSEFRRIDAELPAMKHRLEAARDAALAAQGFAVADRSPRFGQSLEILAGRKRVFVQEPTGYYFPGLPHVQYFNPADFVWVPEVEAATDDIRAELETLLRSAGTREFRPYIQSDANAPRLDGNSLLDNADWSALFLCENGKVADDIVAQCPKTWAAVQNAPLPWIASSPTVMFSLLRAGARIAPHTGTHNTRLVCHLPLIVPAGCLYRVGNEIREWEEGKILIFDDTIEHEAWNDGSEDRVVLIFDIWRPELSEREQREVGALFQSHVVE